MLTYLFLSFKVVPLLQYRIFVLQLVPPAFYLPVFSVCLLPNVFSVFSVYHHGP